MDNKLMQEFENPGSEYRGKPFWAWNGKLEPEELRRQIRIMDRMGLGGFFMHSRVGLDTAYLSEDWFECVDACIDEAKKLGMEAWLYDEDRWPSGAAGGLVTKNPKHRMRGVTINLLEDPKSLRWSKDTVAVFTAKIDGNNASDVKRISRGSIPKLAKGETVVEFVIELEKCSSWYNGYTYLDTLSKEAVKEFIQVTHEKYRKKVGKDFGKVIPGIFTDEPNHMGKFQKQTWFQGPKHGYKIPWTGELPATFKRRYGYDLIPRLMEMSFTVDGNAVSQVSYHYNDCVTQMFVDAFSKQIGDWCGKNGIQFTGHALEEDTLVCQTNKVGSCMRFYEYMQAPGMDLLTEYWRVYDTAKQVSSAARQFGRKWRLTETYGCTGWDFSFEGHKALGDWQAALGINIRCQHLSWYTMLAQAKRDYPAGIFYQSPWWEDYRKVEDYFGRITAVMTRGEEVRDILVVQPLESVWALCKCGWTEDKVVNEIKNGMIDLRDTLLSANLDFDYGDEDIMSRHCKISSKNGKVFLQVGKAGYSTVVIPPMLTMRKSTLRILRKFAEAGGSVIFAGRVASYVDALPSDEVEVFAKQCVKAPAKGDNLADAAESGRRISITDKSGKELGATLYLLREDKDAFYLFICNTGHELKGGDGMVRDRKLEFSDVTVKGLAGCKGQIAELDPDSGEMFMADAKVSAGGVEIRTSLPKLGSRLFVIEKSIGKSTLKPRQLQKTIRSSKLGGGKWDISLSESNSLLLCRPEYKIDGGKWCKPKDILEIDAEARDHLGLSRRGGQMVQPWARKKTKNPKSVKVSLRYRFDVKNIPSGDCSVALEKPELFNLCLNEIPLSTDADCGWWVDLSLRKIPFSASMFRTGENELVLETEVSENHPGLEYAYILGNFGTAAKGFDVSIEKQPETVKIGDWVKQGLTFYSGSVAYCRRINPKLQKGERLFVRIPEYRGTAVKVWVDGRSAGVVAWAPNEIDITDLVGDSPIDLRIEVISHRRNSHGPFYKDMWLNWTGPDSYTQPIDAKEQYCLVPCGMMKDPVLEFRK